MQKVFLWSSVTYECTHVTPNSALVSTTDRQACAPCSVSGISSPSGNERSTMNLAIGNLLAVCSGDPGGSPSASGYGWPTRPPSGRRLSRCSVQVLISGESCRHLDPRGEPQLVEDGVHVIVDRAL